MRWSWSRRRQGKLLPKEKRPGRGKHLYPWWVDLFFAIGVAATIGAVLALFSSVGQRAENLRSTDRPAVGSPEFLAAVSGATNTPVRSGGTVQLLNNGTEIFPALVRDLRAAQRTIDFMVYIWEPGRASDMVLAALIERARAGVQVRVMLDGMGGKKAPDEGFEQLRAAGGKVVRFQPMHFGELSRYHRRNHRRAIVIDGVVGYTGGAAVADKWLGDARNPEEWREAMVRVTGPPAVALQAAFAQLWSVVSGEIPVGPAFYPPDPAAPTAGEPITQNVGVVSSPSDASLPLRKLFWLTFASARQRLYLTNAYFVPDHELLKALEERARAGVDVRVLVPGDKTDAKPVRWASQSHYEELLRAGVRIYEYQPTMIHTKTLAADGVWSVVGSANMDIRSMELNQENVLGILDRGFAAQVERTFLEDVGRAKEVRLAEWERRPWWHRAAERTAELFDEQF